MYANAGCFLREIRSVLSFCITGSTGDHLYFGSEMRAVRAAMPDGADIDPVSLNLFLRYRYTPSPYTILNGVRKLAPGTKLTVQNGSAHVSRWYRFQAHTFCTGKVTPGSRRRTPDSIQTGCPAATDQ